MKNNNALSPEKYITTKARALGIKNCYISDNWQSSGLAVIIVSRQHKQGNVTHALYQVDMLAEGVVNTFYEFNLGGDKYDKVIDHYIKEQNLIKCSYDLAHQVIYEAYLFALEFKLKPHSQFAITKYILESDSYEPSEEHDFEIGENNKPLVIISASDDKKELISKLIKGVGHENFKVIHIDDLAKEQTHNHSHDHSHNHSHDHSHDHDQTNEHVFDLPDNVKSNEREDVNNWSENDWQDFEEGKKEVSMKTTLQVIDFMYDSHFAEQDKSVVVTSEILQTNKLSISNKTIEENNFFKSKKEEERVGKLFSEVLKNPSANLKTLLENELTTNKENPQIYSYLSNVCIKLGELDEADKWTELGLEKFPNYLFGKISYAQTLLQKGESSKVLSIFNNNYSLKDILPTRKQFHILEVVNFYAIMCLYFATQKDIASANVYWKEIKDLKLRDEELVLLAENELMVLKAKVLKGE